MATQQVKPKVGTTEGTDQASAERNLRQDYEELRKDEQARREAEEYERSKRDEKGEGMLNFGLRMLGGKKKDESTPKEKSFAESLGKAAQEVLKNPPVKKAKGGAIKSASSRADGCAIRGKTKGKMV